MDQDTQPPSTHRSTFVAHATERFVGPGIYRVKVSDKRGSASGHTAVMVALDLAAGIEAIWPHDTDPIDATIEATWIEAIPGSQS